MTFKTIIILVALSWCSLSIAQDRIYRCGNEYTNVPDRARENSCVLITNGSASKEANPSRQGAKQDAPAKQTTPVKPPEKTEAVAVKLGQPTAKKFTLSAIQGDRVDLAATRLRIETLIDAVKKAAVVSDKGEFESTADYEARKLAARSTSFLGGSTLNDIFAISIPVSKWGGYGLMAYTFNPDASEGAFFVLPNTGTGGIKSLLEKGQYGSESGIDFFQNLAKSELSKSTYEGSNAYGAKVTVEKSAFVSYGLAANRIPFLTFGRKDYYGSDLTSASNLAVIRFKMDGATASKTIPVLKALIVFSIRYPFIIEDSWHVKPKIDSPEDFFVYHQFLRTDVIGIVWYSQATGEVFARLPENFGKTPAPTPTPTPTPAPAPAPAPALPPIVPENIGVLCPTQVAPRMPRLAIQDVTQGVVKAQIMLRGGVVQKVTILSGPPVFHAAVKAAIMQYKCVADDSSAEVTATQEFNFRFEATPDIPK